MKILNEAPKPFLNEYEERPWGYYGLYADNQPCTTKILYIKPQEMLSMQFHFLREQFYLILDDNFLIQYSTIPVPKDIINNPNEAQRFADLDNFLDKNIETVLAKEGDMFGFHKLIVHRARYLGTKSYGRILDIALQKDEGDKNDELDIVRIKDAYGRC
jgi:hypothetical protein